MKFFYIIFVLFSACLSEDDGDLKNNRKLTTQTLTTQTTQTSGMTSNGTSQTNNFTQTTGKNNDIKKWDPAFDGIIKVMQDELAESQASAASIAVWSDGKIVYKGSVGKEHPVLGGEVTEKSRFSIGSVTKVMSSAILLRDIEEGLYTPESTLEELLPEFQLDNAPMTTDAITIEDLLTHQAGFVDWLPWDGDSEDEALATTVYGEFSSTGFLWAPPASFFNYSNPNFSLVGLISEKTGTAWPDRLQSEIFDPLKMTGCAPRGVDLFEKEDIAVGWGPNLQTGILEPIVPSDYDPAFSRPAGFVWCTPTDVLAFGAFLIDGNPAVLKNHRALSTPRISTLAFDDFVQYGYGLYVNPGLVSSLGYHQTPMWYHNGITLGHTAELFVLPKERVVIAILSSGRQSFFPITFNETLEAMNILPPITVPPERELDVTRLDLHVGQYNDPNQVIGRMDIRRQDNQLIIDLPDLTIRGIDFMPVLAQSGSDLFYVNIENEWYELAFIHSTGSMNSTWIRNRNFVARREIITALSPPLFQKQTEFPPSILSPDFTRPFGWTPWDLIKNK